MWTTLLNSSHCLKFWNILTDLLKVVHIIYDTDVGSVYVRCVSYAVSLISYIIVLVLTTYVCY